MNGDAKNAAALEQDALDKLVKMVLKKGAETTLWTTATSANFKVSPARQLRGLD